MRRFPQLPLPTYNHQLIIFLSYLSWAILLTYPLILHPLSHIPQGDEPVATVPLFNLWTLQWNIDQLMQGYPRYWDAPIFAPLSGTFAFSEPQPLTALLAMPLWLSGPSPAVGYNAVILLFLTLNGWFTFWLLRHWRLTTGPAFMGGLLMQSLPFVAAEMGVLQLIAIFGYLWSLLFLARLAQPNRSPLRHAICLSLGLSTTFLTCGYYGLFSLLFLPWVGLMSLWQSANRRLTAGYLLLAISLFLLLSGPFLVMQQQPLAQHGFTRSEQTITHNSAQLSHYLTILDYNIVYTNILNRHSEQGFRLFPGLLVSLMALLGLMGSRQKRIRYLLALLVLLAFGLSLGLRLDFNGLRPYQWLRDFLPGFAQLRSPFRFSVMLQIHLTLLAGFGLQTAQHGLQMLWRKRPNPVQTWLVHGSFITLTLPLLLEPLALPLPLLPLTISPETRPWQRWLTQQQPSPTVIHLPYARNSSVADFEQTVRWMLTQRTYQANLVNGYSGFFPPDHATMRQQMAHFPSPASLTLLHEKQTDYVIIHHQQPNAPNSEQLSQTLPLLFFDDINQVGIYRLSHR